MEMVSLGLEDHGFRSQATLNAFLAARRAGTPIDRQTSRHLWAKEIPMIAAPQPT